VSYSYRFLDPHARTVCVDKFSRLRIDQDVVEEIEDRNLTTTGRLYDFSTDAGTVSPPLPYGGAWMVKTALHRPARLGEVVEKHLYYCCDDSFLEENEAVSYTAYEDSSPAEIRVSFHPALVPESALPEEYRHGVPIVHEPVPIDPARPQVAWRLEAQRGCQYRLQWTWPQDRWRRAASEGREPAASTQRRTTSEPIARRRDEDPMPGTSGFHSCFISHSHADKPFARKLHDTLQAHGVRCWLDEKELLPGQDLHDEIEKGVRRADRLILVCSQNSLKGSWWVDAEVTAALEKEQKLTKDRGEKALVLIPLDLDGYLFSDDVHGKAATIRSRVAGDFKEWEDDEAKFERELERLVRALNVDPGGREEPLP